VNVEIIRSLNLKVKLNNYGRQSGLMKSVSKGGATREKAGSKQKELNKKMDNYAQFSQKSKTDSKARETMQIGKPAGKKNTDDRENINQMR